MALSLIKLDQRATKDFCKAKSTSATLDGLVKAANWVLACPNNEPKKKIAHY